MKTLNGNIGTLDDYMNAAGCGIRPICAFTKNCKTKVANWQTCVATNSAIKKAGKFGVDPATVVPGAVQPNVPSKYETSQDPAKTDSALPESQSTGDNSQLLIYGAIGLAVLIGAVVLIKVLKN